MSIVFLTNSTNSKMHSQPEIYCKTEQKKELRPHKGFNKRPPVGRIPPHSYEFSKAKQRAYERYKRIYPVEDKQNIYCLSKTPSIGYYLMKGYRQESGGIRETTKASSGQLSNSSDKIITHMFKRYLVRKEQSAVKQQKALPKIDSSMSLSNQGNLTSTYLRTRKHAQGRVVTEGCEKEERLRGIVLRGM